MNFRSNNFQGSIYNDKKSAPYPCISSNGGTALKPTVEFDAVSKTHVELSITVNMDFIKANLQILKCLVISELLRLPWEVLPC